MRFFNVCAGILLAGSVMVAGCKSSDKPADTPMTGGTNGAVTTAPTTEPTTTVAALPTTVQVTVPNAVAPVVLTPATKPAIVATHVVTKAQPYYAEVPASPTAAPTGTFPSGTKVLVFSFSGPYAKVTAEDGTSGYTAIDGIDPISTKK